VRPGTGASADSEPMLTMCFEPPGAAAMASIAARDPHITPSRFTSTIRRTSSSGCSHAFTVCITPALLTQTSTRPRSAAAAAAARCEPASRTSICSAVSRAASTSTSPTSTA
jgi:hypothetical protein